MKHENCMIYDLNLTRLISYVMILRYDTYHEIFKYISRNHKAKWGSYTVSGRASGSSANCCTSFYLCWNVFVGWGHHNRKLWWKDSSFIWYDYWLQLHLSSKPFRFLHFISSQQSSSLSIWSSHCIDLNNFNDYQSGILTMFNILIVNDWFLVASVFLNADKNSSEYIVYPFFISANLIAVNILLNVLTAFFVGVSFTSVCFHR
jgi:hypothetical protein